MASEVNHAAAPGTGANEATAKDKERREQKLKLTGERKGGKQKLKQKQKQQSKPTKTIPPAPVVPFPLIDIGANLLDPVFLGCYRGKAKHSSDLEQTLSRAAAFGVRRIMVTAGTLEEATAALDFTAKYDPSATFLASAVGVHPTRCNAFEEAGDGGAAYLASLMQVAKTGAATGRIVAIGECGLDYDRLHFCSKEVQLRHFAKHFDLTEATGLPMFLHDRNTGGDFAAIIKQNRHRFSSGVVHSFTGTSAEAKTYLDLGLYIGINGCSLKTAENLEVLKEIPVDKLLLETDAPWCGIKRTHASFPYVQTQWPEVKPERHVVTDGCLVKNRNEPCTMVQVLEAVAGVKEMDAEQLAAAVYQNTLALFFPSKPSVGHDTEGLEQ